MLRSRARSLHLVGIHVAFRRVRLSIRVLCVCAVVDARASSVMHATRVASARRAHGARVDSATVETHEVQLQLTPLFFFFFFRVLQLTHRFLRRTYLY